MTEKKILFISHDASRTGAPIVLLHFLRWLKKKESDLKFDVLLCAHGPLKSEFENVAEEVFVWSRVSGRKETLKKTIRTRSLSYIKTLSKHEKFTQRVQGGNYDLIYSNTAKSSEVLIRLIKLNSAIPIIQHVHELEWTISSYCNPGAFRESLTSTSKVIAVSKIVADNLKRNYSVSNDQLELVYEFVPEFQPARTPKAEMKKSFGLKNEFVLMASGTAILRKGFDLIALIARELKYKRKKNFKLIWVGAEKDEDIYYLVRNELNRYDLNDVVELVEPVTNPIDYFNICDLFLMLSREDPFPLVCLEVANLGKPILCFKDAVGSEEFIDDSTGGSVDYLNITEMCDRIEWFMNNPTELVAAGSNIKNVIADYSMVKSANKINDIICGEIIKV